jgi:hypothetical protein
MLESGIVKLVMGDPAVTAVALTGGFLLELPKDEPLPSWCYRSISDQGDYGLRGEHGFVTRRLQIDCFGNAKADVLLLARAINKVLSGYKGTLADTDQTTVFGCFRSDLQDFFDDPGRTPRRMLEYEIQFCEV